MRNHAIRDTSSRIVNQLRSSLRSSDRRTVFIMWLILFILAFIFFLGALSYIYASSGLFKGRENSANSVESSLTVPKSGTIAPEAVTQSAAVIPDQPIETSQAPAISREEVRINGVAVPLPDNGSIHKEVSSDGNTASIDVNIQSSGSSSSDSTSSSQQKVEQWSDG